MYVLGVTGSADAGAGALVEEVVATLAERGSVATVEYRERAVDAEPARYGGGESARSGDGEPVRSGAGETARTGPGEPPRDADAPSALDSDTPSGSAAFRDAGADTAVALDGDEWLVRGEGRSLDDVLADLAPEHDYAVVRGYGGDAFPTVVLGDVEADEPILATAPDADGVDVAAVVDDLEATEPFETLGSLVARAKRADGAERAGAIATFTGRVRRRDGPDDPPTERLEFEKYDGVADERLAAIREELCDREGVEEVLLHHRTGTVEAGEDIVFVVVLAGHREEAFETVSDGIDRLKAEVPLFKKEVTVEEEFWRHQRPRD